MGNVRNLIKSLGDAINNWQPSDFFITALAVSLYWAGLMLYTTQRDGRRITEAYNQGYAAGVKTSQADNNKLMAEERKFYDNLLEFQADEYHKLLSESRERASDKFAEYHKEILEADAKYNKLFFSTLKRDKQSSAQ